jgi:hypothetical protein
VAALVMRARFTITILTILIVAELSYGQQHYEPLDLAKKIFAKEGFREIKKYVAGEYDGNPNGTDLEKGTISKFLLLEQTETSAVVNMTILDSTGKGLDTYLHFEKDKVWKVNAVRALALTGIIEEAKMALERMTPQQIDTSFSSKEEYDFELGNARLVLELDENIIKHFLANQSEFERIKNLALKQLKTEPKDENRATNLVEDLKQDYQKLFISSVSTGDWAVGNGINFVIGGMVDNILGYIHVSDKKDIPKMSPSRVIMIREIGNGWYLYKTT